MSSGDSGGELGADAVRRRRLTPILGLLRQEPEVGLIDWIITGLAAGWLKRYPFPGRPGGLPATLVLAVIGALLIAAKLRI
ncbi:membrane protein|nr:membrane protein [Candidatus Pantoea persica]